MDLVIKLDIEAAITAALQPERLAPILDKHVTAAITAAIDDATGYRSAFRKGLTEQLTAALPHGLRASDVAKFQHLLNGAVQAAVHGLHNDAIAAAMQKVVDTVMPDVPRTVKLSALMDMARDSFLGRDELKHGQFYAYLDVCSYGGGWLYLDKQPIPGISSGMYGRHHDRADQKYSSAYRLAFNDEGRVYALYLDGKPITPASAPDVISPFDSTLMAMYVGRTRIEVDMADDDVESASAEQDPS